MNEFSEYQVFDGLPVIKIEQAEEHENIYVASNRNNHHWIDTRYGGSRSLIWPKAILKEADVNKIVEEGRGSITWSDNKVHDEIARFIERFEIHEGINDELLLQSLDVVVTERCTLKCRDCSNLMQYYEKPKNSDNLETLKCIRRIAQHARIGCIRLIGGEPLLNTGLGFIIAGIQKTEGLRNVKVEIYTNGTLIPSSEVLNECNSDVTFYISDYGDRSRKIDDLCKTLESKEIRYCREDELVWQDCGTVVEENCNDLEFRYQNCCVNKTYSLLNGILYSCPFSANFHNLYKSVPLESRDGIELLGATDEALANSLKQIIKSDDPLFACRHCKGRDFTVGTVPVAEQTRQILKAPIS